MKDISKLHFVKLANYNNHSHVWILQRNALCRRNNCDAALQEMSELPYVLWATRTFCSSYFYLSTKLVTYYEGLSFREVWILIWSDLVNLNCVTTVNGIESLREEFVWSGVVICRLHLLVLVSELVIPVFSLTVATGLCCVTWPCPPIIIRIRL